MEIAQRYLDGLSRAQRRGLGHRYLSGDHQSCYRWFKRRACSRFFMNRIHSKERDGSEELQHLHVSR